MTSLATHMMNADWKESDFITSGFPRVTASFTVGTVPLRTDSSVWLAEFGKNSNAAKSDNGRQSEIPLIFRSRCNGIWLNTHNTYRSWISQIWAPFSSTGFPTDLRGPVSREEKNISNDILMFIINSCDPDFVFQHHGRAMMNFSRSRYPQIPYESQCMLL